MKSALRGISLCQARSEILNFGDNDLSLLQFRLGGNDSKYRSERFRDNKKLTLRFWFTTFFGYFTRSTVLLKLNSFI